MTDIKKAWWLFGVSLALFVIIALLVVSGWTQSFDPSVLLWINQHANPSFDALFLFLTELGGKIVIATVTFLLTLYFVMKRNFYKAAFVVASVAGVSLLNTLLKTVFDRPRPDLWEWLITETSFSFPSGHSVASAALALTIVVLVWRTKWRWMAMSVGALYVASVGLSRMYLGVHYVSDVIGGWTLAIAWVSLVACVLYILAKRNHRVVSES